MVKSPPRALVSLKTQHLVGVRIRALCQIVWVNKIYTYNREELGHLLDGLIPLLFLFKSVFMDNQNSCFDYPTSGGNMLRMAGDPVIETPISEK